MKTAKNRWFFNAFVENRPKPLVFQCFASKTDKHRCFFNAFRRKSANTIVFSMLFVENRQKPLFFQCFSSPDSILEFRNPSETVSIGFPKRVNAYLKRFFIYLKVIQAALGNRPELLFLQWFSSKTAKNRWFFNAFRRISKNRWFFNAFRRKSPKTVVFSMLFEP